ncbi:MAG: RsmB/NOP family class I SAM-dependent RNA methyltransferase [Gemmatimonadota bacterium]
MTPRRRRRRPSRDRVVDLSRYEDIVDDWSAFTAAAERPEPTVFRVSRHRIAESVLLERLHAQGFTTQALADQPGLHQVVEGPHALSATFEHWLGLLYVQQASTAVAAPLLDVGPASRVLDLCSAPGGKTTHLAERMGGRGCLVANEISEPRIRGLLGNIYRLGHPNVLVTSGDGRDAPSGALFDHVLLDAPCSGEGTLRRRGGQPPNQSTSFVRYVTTAQRRLLERAVELLQPGGTVLYVTCTFSPEENEAVVSDALSRLPVDLVPLDLPVHHAPGITSFGDERYDDRLTGAARIYPHHRRVSREDARDRGPPSVIAISGFPSLP